MHDATNASRSCFTTLAASSRFANLLGVGLIAVVVAASVSAAGASELDRVLATENQAAADGMRPAPLIDDWSFLRRAYIDLVGRIPNGPEIREFRRWPLATRRRQLVTKLVEDPRFADRWTAFFSDLLRIRSSQPGGTALMAFVHQSLDRSMPYDELARRLIATNGKANATPEAGFVLGEDADPLALAAVTSQVFLGVRIGCAQCHDHPFDDWSRQDFYALAAYFGRTRQVRNNLTRTVFTTEGSQQSVLWPPEDEADADSRRPMQPRFPFRVDRQQTPDYVARFQRLRSAQASPAVPTSDEPSLDSLLDSTAEKAKLRTAGRLDKLPAVGQEAKREIRQIDLRSGLYQPSQLRRQLAERITDPHNQYFSQAIVNRVWKELVGRGFVEPVDDFRVDNPPSHPRTLAFLSQEFVARGFDFRWLVQAIVLSDVYQRGHAAAADQAERQQLEELFLVGIVRRMPAEALYDSIVTAGHLFEEKHPAGANRRTVVERMRQFVPDASAAGAASLLAGDNRLDGAAMAMAARGNASAAGYRLEDAIEIDFQAALKPMDEVAVERMQVISTAELEAMRMRQQRPARPGKYVTKTVERSYDDNPKFVSALRMASPAPSGHFLRVFGQPDRNELGVNREDAPSMRQALMMLNGRLTHEASRVGKLEPIHRLLSGPQLDLPRAVRIAYYEILTREPTARELAEATRIVEQGDSPPEGMADLRWVLLNCNEFRFLP